jgi:hypothetical protein
MIVVSARSGITFSQYIPALGAGVVGPSVTTGHSVELLTCSAALTIGPLIVLILSDMSVLCGKRRNG